MCVVSIFDELLAILVCQVSCVCVCVLISVLQ